jgi:hypothetical protein
MRGRYGTRRRLFFQREITVMAKSAAASWLPGALAVFFAHIAWVGLVVGQAHAEWLMGAIIVMSFVTSNSAGIGAFITALRAPRHGFLLGLGMAPLAAVLAVLSNLAVRLAGVHIDLSGFRGILGLFAVTLGYGLFVAVIGGAIGAWGRRRAARDAQAVSTPTVTPVAATPPPEPPPLG